MRPLQEGALWTGPLQWLHAASARFIIGTPNLENTSFPKQVGRSLLTRLPFKSYLQSSIQELFVPDHSMIADLHVSEMIHDLLDDNRCVMLSKAPDGIYTGNAGPGRASNALTLEDCIEGLFAHSRKKICVRDGCASKGEPQSIGAFGPDNDSRDGHAGECRKCAAARITAHNKKKKSILAAGHEREVRKTGGKV